MLRGRLRLVYAASSDIGPGLLVVGAKWGAINGRYRATQDLLNRSILLIY
jgi:hypothetical protein